MKKKKLLTLILSLFLMCSVVCGTLFLVPNTKAEEDDNPEWLSSFTMLAGAEVRTAEPNGIRFTTEISATEYNAIMAKVDSGEYQSVEFGTLICPNEYAEDGAIKSDTNTHVIKIAKDSWDVEYNPTRQTDVYQYNGDLLGLTTADMVREYQALGYCTITPAQGEAVTYYATVENEGDNVRSPLYVASYNVMHYGNEDDYLLAMIDSAMEGKTLALSQTGASLFCKEELNFPIVATVDGVEVGVCYTVEDPSIASYTNGKLIGLNAGSTNIVATLTGAEGTFTAKVPVTVAIDVSRFAGLEAKTSTAKDGLSAVMVYEKGVGLWVKVEATHNTFTKGWGGSGVNVEVKVGSATHFIYYGTDGVGVIDFDSASSNMSVTENAEGEKYSTLVVGLITDEKLLAAGITQGKLDKAEIPVVHAAFGSPSDGWWYIHRDVYVGEEGYFVPEKPLDVSRFEGLEAKTITEQDGARSASSTLVYEKGVGLWFMIKANHNAFAKGWGGEGLDLDVAINGKEYWLYYGTGGVGVVSTGTDGVGFDLERSDIRVTENAQGSATAYSTLMVALLSEATLLADGMPQASIDKCDITIEWLAIKSPGEESITGTAGGMWLIHGEAHVGERGYFIPVPPIDVSRFEGLEAKTSTAKDGLSAVMVYEKGVGLWVKVEATHNTFTKGWGGSGVNVEVKVGSKTCFIYYGTGGVGVIDFDADASAMRVTENAEGEKYSTLVVGLITDDTLLAAGITQSQLDKAEIPVVHAAFGSPSDGWWYIHSEAHVGEEGYFVPVPEEPEVTIDVTRFEGLEAKTKTEQGGARSASSTLVYEKGVGLWFMITVNHNSFEKGWGGSGLDLDLAINGKEYWLYYGTSGVGAVSTGIDGVGFDLDESDIIVTENAQGSATVYSTLMVALIPEQTLLADGVSQDLIDKCDITIEWLAIKSPGEDSITGNQNGMWVIHGEAHVGEEGYFVPAPVVVDPFEGKPTKSLVANDGSRVLTSTMFYEPGVGLWVKVDAKHKKFVKGWAGSGLDLDITVEGVQIILYYGTSGPASCFGDGADGGFDMTKTTFVVTENAADDYTTAIVGLIPVQTLLDKGVLQTTLDNGYLKVITAFKSPSEGSFVDAHGYPTPNDWWYIHRELLVSANGYLTGGETVKTMNFTDTTTKKAFNFSATLTEFGLYIQAEVKTNDIGEGLIHMDYYTNYWTSSNGGCAQFFLGISGGETPTWKRTTNFANIDANTYGYTNRVMFEALYDWTFLKNLGLMSLNNENPLESTIYLNPYYNGGESMSYIKSDATEATTSTSWGFCGNRWTPIDTTSVKTITLHITKNGIIN